MEYRRAVVFPGQGTSGGEVSGEVERAVGEVVKGGEVPYQISVFASSMSLFNEFHDLWGLGFDVAAGHSLGEYAAACAVGSLGLRDAVRLVFERDRLMNEAAAQRPGVMVAVIGGDPEAVAQAVEEVEGVAVAANFNTPRQTVVSGEKEAVEEVVGGLKGRKVPLKVAGAFHSPLMRGASEEMEGLLRETEFREPGVPMIGAADGELLESAEQIHSALVRQMLSPVRWVTVVQRLAELGVTEVIEAGEDGTLTRMLRDFKGEEFARMEGKKTSEVAS